MAITRNHQAEYTHWRPEETKLIEGVPVRFRDVCVHTIRLGDVEDPELYAAQPLSDFLKTEKGQWLEQHSKEQMIYNVGPCPETYGWRVWVSAFLEEEDLTYFQLRWSN